MNFNKRISDQQYFIMPINISNKNAPFWFAPSTILQTRSPLQSLYLLHGSPINEKSSHRNVSGKSSMMKCFFSKKTKLKNFLHEC